MDSPIWKLPELAIAIPALCIQWLLARWLLELRAMRASPAATRAARLALPVVCLWLLFGLSYSFTHAASLLPYRWWLLWIRGAALVWTLCSAGMLLVAFMWRQVPAFDPRRRRLLAAGRAAMFAAPVVWAGFGILVERTRFRVKEVNVLIPGLPKDLDGLRLAQITDIHMSPFLSPRDLDRAVDMANETRPHVALVTGDLVTAEGDPLDACLRGLTRLRAEAGIIGCLGNHEVFANCQTYTAAEGERLGIRFLRWQSEALRFGDAWVNFAGVDYQPMKTPYLRGAGLLVKPGSLNVLLSHNPDVFPEAAAQGWDLTIAGHTHGGQITMEILHQYVNVARFFTPYVYGLYRMGRSSAYVSRGLGTVGVPLRVGAPPEISLIRLCAS